MWGPFLSNSKLLPQKLKLKWLCQSDLTKCILWLGILGIFIKLLWTISKFLRADSSQLPYCVHKWVHFCNTLQDLPWAVCSSWRWIPLIPSQVQGLWDLAKVIDLFWYKIREVTIYPKPSQRRASGVRAWTKSRSLSSGTASTRMKDLWLDPVLPVTESPVVDMMEAD